MEGVYEGREWDEREKWWGEREVGERESRNNGRRGIRGEGQWEGRVERGALYPCCMSAGGAAVSLSPARDRGEPGNQWFRETPANHQTIYHIYVLCSASLSFLFYPNRSLPQSFFLLDVE